MVELPSRMYTAPVHEKEQLFAFDDILPILQLVGRCSLFFSLLLQLLVVVVVDFCQLLSSTLRKLFSGKMMHLSHNNNLKAKMLEPILNNKQIVLT